MKSILFSLIVFIAIATSATAQDTFDELTTSKGKTYKDVTVKGKGALGISIKHSTGLAKIPFSELSEEIRKKYNYDPEKAKIAAEQRAASIAKIKARKAEALAKRRASLAAETAKQTPAKVEEPVKKETSEEEADEMKALVRRAKKETFKVIAVTFDGVFATIQKRKNEGIGLTTVNGGFRISSPLSSKSTMVLLRSDDIPLMSSGDIIEALVVEDGTAKYATPEGDQVTIKAVKAVKWLK